MFDAHAHIGEITENAFICTESTAFLREAAAFRHWALGTIPGGNESDMEKLRMAAGMGGHIGEIGLDKRYPGMDGQIRVFREALSIAREMDRIAVIHSVRTYGTVYGILSDMKVRRFIIHGFTGSAEMARAFIGLGGVISISPRMRKAKSFPEMLTLPFVTETDMRTGKEEEAVLGEWNSLLSTLTGVDIAERTERIMEDLLC